jgi:Type VI secretion system effector, Hcp
MKLQQIIRDKFSIVLTMAMIFLALPAIAAAQHNTGALRNFSGDNTYTGGIFVGNGDPDSGALANRIQVSRISLLTGAFDGGVGVVNSCDADAARKIRMLFDVRSNLRLTNDIAIEIAQNNTLEWFEMMNYLRRAQASGTKIPMMKLTVADGKSQPDSGKFETYLEIKMQEVLVSSYQTGGTEIVPTDQFSLNFGAIKFEYKPQKE